MTIYLFIKKIHRILQTATIAPETCYGNETKLAEIEINRTVPLINIDQIPLVNQLIAVLANRRFKIKPEIVDSQFGGSSFQQSKHARSHYTTNYTDF